MRPVSCRAITVAILGFCSTAVVDANDAVGWRNQGDGHFVAEHPPTKWSKDEGVVWKTKMPGPTYSSPIATGDYVITTAEPAELICLNRKSGEVLWQRRHLYEDVFPAEKAKQIAARLQQAQGVQEKIEQLQKQLQELQQAQANSAESPEAKALNEQIATLQKEYESLTDYPPLPQDGVGNTTCTPVSDDQHVWAVFATGIVSCHQLNGERKWMTFLEKPEARLSSSPLLIDGRLILHMKHLMALNAETGEIIWQVETPPRSGSPVLISIGDSSAIVTAGGAVVRASDGKVLAESLFDMSYCSPVAHEDVVYAVERGTTKAIRLTPSADGSLAKEVLWETRSAEEDQCASPLVHDGLLYSATGIGILDVLDAKTGKRVYRKRLNLGDGRVDPSLVLAGQHLLVSSNNGTTVVLKPGREYQEVSKNPLEGFSSSAFVHDNQLCIRTADAMYCIDGSD